MLSKTEDLNDPITHDADDFDPPAEGGPEEDPSEPVSGDGGEGYPVRGGGTTTPAN